MTLINWSQLIKYRKQLPDIRQYKRINDYENFALRYIKRTNSVLDIGCGDGRYRRNYLLPHGHQGKYIGMDIDTDLNVGFPLYHSLDSISDTFDVILMFDVIEHLDFEQFISYLQIITKLLRPYGKLLISTSNVYSMEHLYTDVTHRTFYPYKDLYSILRYFKFKSISIYRVGKRNNMLHVILFYSRLVDTDFCGNIFICACLF